MLSGKTSKSKKSLSASEDEEFGSALEESFNDEADSDKAESDKKRSKLFDSDEEEASDGEEERDDYDEEASDGEMDIEAQSKKLRKKQAEDEYVIQPRHQSQNSSQIMKFFVFSQSSWRRRTPVHDTATRRRRRRRRLDRVQTAVTRRTCLGNRAWAA